MRGPLLVLMVTVTTLVAASGVALAVVLDGGPGDDDTLRGLADGDELLGGPEVSTRFIQNSSR